MAKVVDTLGDQTQDDSAISQTHSGDIFSCNFQLEIFIINQRHKFLHQTNASHIRQTKSQEIAAKFSCNILEQGLKIVF